MASISSVSGRRSVPPAGAILRHNFLISLPIRYLTKNTLLTEDKRMEWETLKRRRDYRRGGRGVVPAGVVCRVATGPITICRSPPRGAGRDRRTVARRPLFPATTGLRAPSGDDALLRSALRSIGSTARFRADHARLLFRLHRGESVACRRVPAARHDVIGRFVSRLPGDSAAPLDRRLAAPTRGPGAKSPGEAILLLPQYQGDGQLRIAHQLYLLEVPLIPRIITGDGAFADRHRYPPRGLDRRALLHGSRDRIVIGETSVIGNHVRIYQG